MAVVCRKAGKHGHFPSQNAGIKYFIHTHTQKKRAAVNDVDVC